MTEVTVESSKTYRIIIGENMIPVVGDLIRETCGGSAACVVCGDTVDGLYADEVCNSLTDKGYITYRFVYPHGEQSKNAETYVNLLNHLADCHMTRSDVVVALGGGVTGDLSGFAAATYMRGIKYVQVPTTLLAMVDSSVGGKTAIDLNSGKNLAGAFWQPELVICDHDVLETLPEDIFRQGCAEIVKYAVLADKGILELLENPKENIERIIQRCVTIKRDIVNVDEYDRGKRQLLNLGHTVGHAVEKLSDYSISHGEAVSTGLAIVLRAAVKNGDCEEDLASKVITALESLELPVNTQYAAEEIEKAIMSDKKRSGNLINMIIPRKLGECEIRSMPVDSVRRYIEKGLI